MNNQPSFGYVIAGLVLMVLLFFGGMWVGVWVDDEKYTPDPPEPDSPELQRLMLIAQFMQKAQNSISANHGLLIPGYGEITDGDESGAFDDGFDDGFS